MKIDVEGGELGVLRGADDLLGRHAPVVLCELSSGRSPVLPLFEAKGYEVHASTAPDVPLTRGPGGEDVPEVSDFVAVPPRLIDSWQELRQEWRRKLS